MEADWQEVARIAIVPPDIRAAATPVSTFAFDTNQELLWVGNGYGRVTSFYGTELQRYTSYRGNSAQEGPVKQILPCEKGIISIGARSIHLASRKGLCLWHLTQDDFKDLRCICALSKDVAQILVGGCQDQMFKVDVEKAEVVQTIPAVEQYTILKRGGQYICAATPNGVVQLLEPKTFEVLKTWKAHMGWINDMDANSSFLITCGWSPRQHFGNVLDPLAKVFDLKTLMPLPPVPFHAGAAFVTMHPRMLTTAIIASPTGQIQLVDIMNSSMVNVRQVNLVDSYLVSLEIAPSSEALALADSAGMIQLWGSPSRLTFSDYSSPVDFADTAASEHTNLSWSSNEPLHTIGMPYYRETLLSAWPGHMLSTIGALPPKIDPAVTAALTRTEFGAYAPNPHKMRRNQVEDTRTTDRVVGGIEGPKFLSEQAKEGGVDLEERRMSDVLDALNSSSLEGSMKIDVPAMYRNVEIKYSKFGVEDFDFEYYNKTRFSGLETHIANSYANPLLQLLKFTPYIRNLALHHTATPCLFETCLLCEMGFLFDMLEKANGQNCQATNLLRTFSSLSHAASLGLLEDSAHGRPLTVMIQSTTRFLLDKIAADFRQTSRQGSHMDQLLTTAAMNSIRCAHCANETVRHGGTYIHELVYPSRNSTKSHGRNHGPTFSQVLKASIERQDQTRGWCDRCKRYQQLSARKTIQSLPPVLMINAAVHNTDAKQLWTRPNWLPQEIGVVLDQGQFFCYEGHDLNFHVQRGAAPFKLVIYELIGVVADIGDGERPNSHLVAMINVSPSMREAKQENQWHLFNDFVVRKISDIEALHFDPAWKLPCVLTYQIKSGRHRIDDTWKESLDTSLLYRKWPMHQNSDPSLFRTLSYPSEQPMPGTIVGIDAEFVALQQEELEVKPDGSRSTIRPSRLGLARVSILRCNTSSQDSVSSGSNSNNENEFETEASSDTDGDYVPFIDDYIQIPEPIVDYLTLYSGIQPGDLDPKTSRHVSTGRLVSLKIAYKKIWLLLNLGCVFVGHGLLKDFRTINIHVPKKQVVDTVDIYYIKKWGRKLSLKFLTWIVLGEAVQTSFHDSVEDARTALRLWRAWQRFEREGRGEEVLNDVYRKGWDYGFKVPSSVGGADSRQGLFSENGPANTHTPSPYGNGDGGTDPSVPSTPRGRTAGLVPVQKGLEMDTS